MNNKINKNFLVALLIDEDTENSLPVFYNIQQINAKNRDEAETIYNKQNNYKKIKGICVGYMIDNNLVVLSDYFNKKLLNKFKNEIIKNCNYFILAKIKGIDQESNEYLYKDIIVYQSNESDFINLQSNNYYQIIGTYNHEINSFVVKLNYINIIDYIENEAFSFSTQNTNNIKRVKKGWYKNNL